MPVSMSGISLESELTDHYGSSIRSDMEISKKWWMLEPVKRFMTVTAIVAFCIGLTLTMFGFANVDLRPTQRLALQITGPLALGVAIFTSVARCVAARLWQQEQKRRQAAVELRDRVQLHALAMDILDSRTISPTVLCDPARRRQLLLRLRAQKAIDLRSLGSTDCESRKSSRSWSYISRGASAIQYERDLNIVSRLSGSRAPSENMKGCKEKNTNNFDLPGIQISRFETVDLGNDGVASVYSRGSRRYIVINSEAPNEYHRCSDFSLGGSRSSRSSRASSGVGSRLWDFSPRDSEWDADISVGSRDSQGSIRRPDWPFDTIHYYDNENTLSSNIARKSSVVTFDVDGSSIRRHSSPVPANRRKDSDGTTLNKRGKGPLSTSVKSSKGVLLNTTSHNSDDYSARAQTRSFHMNAFRKRSMEQSFKSLTIEEDEPDILEERIPLMTTPQDIDKPGTASRPKPRPLLIRNNTDDSEVERRVAKIFRDIEFSTVGSVDERCLSLCCECRCHCWVDRKDAQIQTLSEAEMEDMLETVSNDALLNLCASSRHARSEDMLLDGLGSENTRESKRSKNKLLAGLKNTPFGGSFSGVLTKLSGAFSKENKYKLPTDILSEGMSSESIKDN